MAAFLIQTAVPRVMLFEALECRERVGDLMRIPLADGHHVQDVAILGNLNGQRRGCGRGLGKRPALQEFSYPANFGFYR
jgi:hypothetical protein